MPMQLSLSWNLIRSAVLLTVGAFLAPACGGSAEFTAAQAGAAGSSAGGKGGDGSGGNNCPRSCPAFACVAGFKSVLVPGDCCPSCVPDGSGGGGGACTGCVTIGCGPGFKSVQQPGDCCPSCVPDGSGGAGGGNPCANVDCPAIDCANGYKYQSAPGQCCGTCVPDDAACSKGQANYQNLRKALLADPSTLKCAKDTDCKLLAQNPFCGDQCAAVPVSVPAAMSIDQQLGQFAAANCSTCTPVYPPRAAPPPPMCIGGQCVLGGYL